MKILLSIFLLSLISSSAICNASTDSLLTLLKSEISRKKLYDEEKDRRIINLKQTLANEPNTNYAVRYLICDKLYNEYKDYIFDSAHVYTRKLLELSSLMHDNQKLYESRIKLGTIQLSWGMFKEAFDCLNQLDPNKMPDTIKFKYYELKSRAYTKQAAYNTDKFYSAANLAESVRSIDSAKLLAKPGSYENFKYTAESLTRSGHKAKAEAYYRMILVHNVLSDHERAMVINDLSGLVTGPERIKLITLAAIYDIRSSTKETLAIFTLGKYIFKIGNIADAELLLLEALKQAQFYGNRLHQTEIVAILTTVSAQKLINSENAKNRILSSLIIILFLAIVATAMFAMGVYNRLKRVIQREKVIQEKNHHLDKINKKLLEDSHIKEEYIGYFFDVISSYILKLEKIKRNAERKFKAKAYDELAHITNEIDIKQERYNLFYTFDSVFLKLFPNFVKTFNSLLKPEDQIWPKDNEVLNTNLRIFALMRLGVKDNQTIANILESAVSTIYTYKMRIKSKALVDGDDFESKIMEIKFANLDTLEPYVVRKDLI